MEAIGLLVTLEARRGKEADARLSKSADRSVPQRSKTWQSQLLQAPAPVSDWPPQSHWRERVIPSARPCVIQKRGSEELSAIAEREHLPLRIAALDVDSDESVRNAFTKILAEAGRIDVLVNNASIYVLAAVEETPIAAFRALMETN